MGEAEADGPTVGKSLQLHLVLESACLISVIRNRHRVIDVLCEAISLSL